MRSKDLRGSPQTNGNRQTRPLFASIRAVAEESITIFAERNRGAKYKGKDGAGGPRGIFTHTRSLAAAVDAKKARASYRGGVLTICAPKLKRDEGR